MAKIALYADKINQFPEVVKELKKAVRDYEDELLSMKKSALSVNTSVSDLSEVISSIQTSIQTQEAKIESLENMEREFEEFVAETMRIDGEVADLINRRREEFYEEYGHLRPDYDKSWIEMARKQFGSATDWCKKRWKAALVETPEESRIRVLKEMVEETKYYMPKERGQYIETEVNRLVPKLSDEDKEFFREEMPRHGLRYKGGSEELELLLEAFALACTASGEHAGALSDEQQKANARFIYNYLSNLEGEEWSMEAVAGLLGNMSKESGVNPGAWRDWHGDNTKYGFVQFDVLDFFAKYSLTADSADKMAGNDPSRLMDLELEYLVNEMKPGGDQWYSTSDFTTKYYSIYPLETVKDGNLKYEEFINSDADAGDLALIFHASFERSGDDYDQLDERVTAAREWYDYLDGLQQ